MEQQQVVKVKIEDLFHHQTEGQLSYFYTSNSILSSAKAVQSFFQNFSQYGVEEQQKILSEIIRCLKSVSTNSYLLNSHNSEHPMLILRSVIRLAVDNVKNYVIFGLLLEVLQLLLPSSTLEEQLMNNVTQRVSRSLYEESISVEHFFGTVNVAKAIYAAKIQAEKQPKHLMMFHGGKGLELLPLEKDTKLGWKFQQGMTVMFWLYVQNIKFGTQTRLPKLFTFFAPNKGGVQAYMIDNKVFYRILGPKYSEPQIGSNGINLGQLQPRKWHFLCFQHEGSKVFMKSRLNFYLNKNKPSTFSIDPPKIVKGQQTKFVLFDGVYGKASSVGMWGHPLGNQQVQEYNRNINSMEQLKKTTKGWMFQLQRGRLYQRGGMGYCTTYVLERDLTMKFDNVLPYFYLMKFLPTNTYPILNQLLGILVLYFRQSAKNQRLAVDLEYLKMVSTLINRSQENIFDQNSIKSLLHVKHTITDTQLLDQYFSDFLWLIVGANAEMERKQEIVEIVKNTFMQNVAHYRNVVGFDQMLNYLICLQPKSVSCCQKHFNLLSKRIQKSSFSFQSYSKAYRNTINYILQLVQIYFQNPNVNFAEECYKLCRLLTLKFSPCFILDLMAVIKKIITQKFNQKIAESQTKKILKYFQERKIYTIFLHVIQNNFFAQIKAEAVKMVYQVLLMKRTDDDVDISLAISKALWKINQERNAGGESPVKSNTSKKIEQEQEREERMDSKEQTKAQKESQDNSIIQKKSGRNFDHMQMQHEQEQEYKEVGPVAPTLRNRDKGNKKFDFNFVNKSKEDKGLSLNSLDFKKQENIDDEDVKIIPLAKEVEPKLELPKKKGKKSFGLSINTEEINEMYTFGGERGQQIVISEEEEKAELEKIRKLARICARAMKKGRGEEFEEIIEEQVKRTEQQEKKAPKMMIPPPTMKNKTLQQRKKKSLNLNLIDQEQEEQQQAALPQQKQSALAFPQQQDVQSAEQPVSLPLAVKKPTKKPVLQMQQISQEDSPNNRSKDSSVLSFSNRKYSLIKSPSNVSPSSNRSSSAAEDSLLALYASLLECLLNMSFQTGVLQNSIIHTPSVLCIFFKWIPQTQLQTKFLNDLDIMTQEPENMDKMTQIPELYDFLFELCYKCILLQELGEKRIYIEKLEDFIKKVYAYIFTEDAAGYSKLNYIVDWSMDKKAEYHPKSLFLTTRYAVVLILQSFQQTLLMNKTCSDKIRERNFQAMGSLIQAMIKYIPMESAEEFSMDPSDRILLAEDLQIIQSLTPYFRTRWIDETACRKFYFLFKKFFSTEWYNKGLPKLVKGQSNFVEIGLGQLQRESSYFLRDNFLVSLIEITRCLFMSQDKATKTFIQLGEEIIWQLLVLVILSQTNKEKTMKNHRSERILCFLKNCKFLAQQNIKSVMKIIPCLSTTKHFLGIMKMNLKQDKTQGSTVFSDGILDEIISNYIPEELLRLDREFDIESFKLHFSDVWVPSQNHHKKLHSELFSKEKQRNRKIQDKVVQVIETISSIIEEENERSFYTEVLLEADRRRVINCFRKIWDELRVYSRIWRIPELKLQNDSLFNKGSFSYQKYHASAYFTYKISKHQSKAKARYFLKLRLTQNTFSQKQLQEHDPHEQNELYLHKAIPYAKDNLSISLSRLTWLFQKDTTSIKELEVIVPFKKVHLINTLTIRNGFLAVINEKMVFVPAVVNEKPNHLAIKQYKLRKDKALAKVWSLIHVKEVLRRRYVNRKKAVQVTFIYGKSILFEFLEQNDLDDFFKKISKLKTKKCANLAYLSSTTDPKKMIQTYGYTAKWNSYEMSNFEYLMQLNNISGRSYADTTQYPVMPWVLINFTSPSKINLADENNYRQLQLPMGALGSEERASTFQQRYHMLTVDDPKKRFHYGTHYSSPGIVYHFLIRLYPFTEGSILLQSGKFDFADRLFFSIADSYKNATTEHSDVRQLLPQLYTLPEVYLNMNGQDFGIMQSKRRVHNVELPEWARDNPYLYVSKLRRAFEQKKVSDSINNWIDLVFGYKQKGEEAVKNLNCFYYLTYQDSVNWEQIEDEKEMHAIEAQVMNFGQTPSQIFVKPHQQRQELSSVRSFNTVSDPNAKIKVYRPTGNKNLLQEQAELNPIRQSPQSIIFMKWIKDERLAVIKRNGDIIYYNIKPPKSGMKGPFQCAMQQQRKIDKMEKNQAETHFRFDPSLNVRAFPIELINKGNSICLGGLLDGKLMVIDVDGLSQPETYNYHSHTISCIRADNKQNFIITGDVKGQVIIWKQSSQHLNKLSFIHLFSDQKAQISSIFFSYQLKCCATASLDGTVFLYNYITNKKIRSFHHPQNLPIDEIAISTNPLACLAMFCNGEGTMYCYSINGQLLQRTHEKGTECFMNVTLMKDSLGFEHVAYGNQAGEVIFRAMPFLDHDVKSPVAKSALVNRVCPSRNVRFLVTGCSDGELAVITDPQTVMSS